MAETTKFLAERLRVEGEKTLALFSTLNTEQWNTIIYTEGDHWTIRNILSHFVTAERGFLSLFKEIQNGGPGAPDDFDIDRFNASQQVKTKEFSPQELLEQYAAVRMEMVNLVSSFTDDDLNKAGRHPYLGQTALSEMIKMVYRHNQIHFRDLRKTLGGE